jgi:hypothetical protein
VALRFGQVTVIIGGQSQAIMALSGGGETIDNPMVGRPPASERLSTLLQAYMPEATVSVTGGSASTAWADTCLLTSYNGGTGGIWNDTAGAFDTKGVTQRDFIQARGQPGRLGVFVHWTQSQDASVPAWNDAYYAAQLGAYYDALHAACAPFYGEFRILPVPVGARATGDEGRVGAMRAIMQSLGGGQPFPGAARRDFVLRPVHESARVPRGAYIQGSADFLHVIRSTAWRVAGHAAVRIAGHNGAVPAPVDQPRLARAIRTGPTTVRAFIVSPARLPLRVQGTPDFRLTSGSIVSVWPIDNTAVAATGFARFDLAVSGLGPAVRLLYAPQAGSYASFVNGTIQPRGAMVRAVFADPTPSASLAVTDGAEDVVDTVPVMHVAPDDAGVAVEQ